MVTHALFWGVLCSSVCVFQMTLQQICADVNRVKSWGQQAYLDSNHKIAFLGKRVTGIAVSHPLSTKQLKCVFFKIGRYFKCWLFILPAPLPSSASNAEVREHKVSRKQTHIPSYQQINCVDNIIRCVAINMTFFFCSTQSLS